jgi:hypothetical protein
MQVPRLQTSESGFWDMFSGYIRKGKRFIPPIYRLPEVVETNFREEKIPELCWVSSLFLQLSDNQAVELVVEFIKACEQRLGKDSTKPLVFISNYLALSRDQMANLMSDSRCQRLFPVLGRFLRHHICLLEGYPLAPLVPLENNSREDGPEVEQLKSDVGELLDRRCHHATKVQATVLISLMATGRLHISRHIPAPDINAIFASPGSEEAEKAAGFVRSTLNAGSKFYVHRDVSEIWRKSFWSQTYGLAPCE